MFINLFFLVAGCTLLYFGGDWLVDGISGLAKRLRVSPIIVAFVVMGFGTSAPELFVAINSAFAGAPDIAIGNIVGSNIANLFLVLALTALVRPLAVDPSVMKIDGSAMLTAALALWVVSLDGNVGRIEGVILVTAMLSYVAIRWHNLWQATDAEEDGPSIFKALLLSLLALIALPVGAHLFVEGARNFATQLGVSEAIIGLTVVAIGTSLPELAACMAAALRKQADMILGGILGSNVFNSTVVLGVTALLVPINISGTFLTGWIPIMVAASIATLVLLRTGFVLSRKEAGFMLAAYCLIFLI